MAVAGVLQLRRRLRSNRSGHSIVWHNGGTGGYRSFLGYDADARVGVVVLSNTFTVAGVDDIGIDLLDRISPERRKQLIPLGGPQAHDGTG